MSRAAHRSAALAAALAAAVLLSAPPSAAPVHDHADTDAGVTAGKRP